MLSGGVSESEIAEFQWKRHRSQTVGKDVERFLAINSYVNLRYAVCSLKKVQKRAILCIL